MLRHIHGNLYERERIAWLARTGSDSNAFAAIASFTELADEIRKGKRREEKYSKPAFLPLPTIIMHSVNFMFQFFPPFQPSF